MRPISYASLAVALLLAAPHLEGQASAYDRAKAAFQKGDRPAARAILESECREGRETARVLSLLGLIHLDPPFRDDALARRLLEKARSLDGKDVYAHYGLGLEASRRRSWSEAVTQLSRALELSPRFSACRYELGVALYQLSRLEEADAAFAAVGDADWRALEYRALVENRRGRSVDAAARIAAILAKHPAHPERGRLLYQQAAFLNQAADADGALPLFQAALDAGYVRAECLNALADLLYDADRIVEARERYELAMAAPSIIQPDLGGKAARRARTKALFRLGVIHYDRKEFPEAEKDLEKSVELDRFHENAWYKLGQVRHRLGKEEAATAAFERHKAIQPLLRQIKGVERSLATDPGNFDNRFELSRMLIACERFDEALVQLLEIAAREPRRKGLPALFVAAHEGLDMPEEAARWRKVLEAEESR